MRGVWLPLICLLTVSAQAAPRTEVIPLTYASAMQMESFLLASHTAKPLSPSRQARSLDELEIFPGMVDPVTQNWYLPGNLHAAVRPVRPATRLLPEGITALTADATENTLSVAGSDDAIKALVRIVRLLDIAPQRVRLSVRAVQMDAAAMRVLPAREAEGDGQPGLVMELDDPQAAAVLARSPRTFADTSMACRNNTPLRMFWARAGSPTGDQAQITPRLNGDRSITVILTAVFSQGAFSTTQSSAPRRIRSGQTLLAIPAPGLGLLVKAEVLPDSPAPPARK